MFKQKRRNEKMMQFIVTYCFLGALGIVIFLFSARTFQSRGVSFLGKEEEVFSWKTSLFRSMLLLVVTICSLLGLLFLVTHLGDKKQFFLALLLLFAVLDTARITLSKRLLVKMDWKQNSIGSLLFFIGFVFCSFFWFFTLSWLSYDLVGFFLIYGVLSYTSSIRIRSILLFFAGFTLYDILGVFVTGFIQKAVMEGAIFPPLLFIVPQYFLNLQSPYLALLGFGDVILSGLVVMTAKKYDLQYWVMGGFLVGLFLSFLLTFVISTGVPATITLTPCLFGSLFLGSKVQKKHFFW